MKRNTTMFLTIILLLTVVASCGNRQLGFMKIRNITKQHKSEYWNEGFKEFHYSCLNQYYTNNEPRFSNVKIPASVSKDFTQDALKSYFNSFNKREETNTFSEIIASGSWSWKTFESSRQKQLRVELYNAHKDAPIKNIVLELIDQKNNSSKYYTITSCWQGKDGVDSQATYPRRDGMFVSVINKQTFDSIRNGDFRARITEIIFGEF